MARERVEVQLRSLETGLRRAQPLLRALQVRPMMVEPEMDSALHDAVRPASRRRRAVPMLRRLFPMLRRVRTAERPGQPQRVVERSKQAQQRAAAVVAAEAARQRAKRVQIRVFALAVYRRPASIRASGPVARRRLDSIRLVRVGRCSATFPAPHAGANRASHRLQVPVPCLLLRRPMLAAQERTAASLAIARTSISAPAPVGRSSTETAPSTAQGQVVTPPPSVRSLLATVSQAVRSPTATVPPAVRRSTATTAPFARPWIAAAVP